MVKFNKELQPLTNKDIIKLANELKISNFRGVFMRDTLPNTPNITECGIVNLDSIKNNGTHWVCYYTDREKCFYFDSFGLDPPEELQLYLNKSSIISSTFQIQKFNTYYCGHLCLYILKQLEKYNYEDIILDLIVTMS
jgi:hypothetical protein